MLLSQAKPLSPCCNTGLCDVTADEASLEIQASDCGGESAATGVNYEIPWLREVPNQLLDLAQWLLPLMPRLLFLQDLADIVPLSLYGEVAFGKDEDRLPLADDACGG